MGSFRVCRKLKSSDVLALQILVSDIIACFLIVRIPALDEFSTIDLLGFPRSCER
jgi:hypothetical protein